MKFHHDNARPHVAKCVVAYLESENFTIVDHPPYSPDLAPSDFWLFDYVKQRLRDSRDENHLASQIVEIVNSIPHKEYKKAFETWIERMKLCLKYEGNYFEHLMNKT